MQGRCTLFALRDKEKSQVRLSEQSHFINANPSSRDYPGLFHLNPHSCRGLGRDQSCLWCGCSLTPQRTTSAGLAAPHTIDPKTPQNLLTRFFISTENSPDQAEKEAGGREREGSTAPSGRPSPPSLRPHGRLSAGTGAAGGDRAWPGGTRHGKGGPASPVLVRSQGRNRLRTMHAEPARSL